MALYAFDGTWNNEKDAGRYDLNTNVVRFKDLYAGKKFFYEVKAELVVDGKTVVEEKKVIVEAGASITESFAKLTAAVAKPDSVAGK